MICADIEAVSEGSRSLRSYIKEVGSAGAVTFRKRALITLFRYVRNKVWKSL